MSVNPEITTSRESSVREFRWLVVMSLIWGGLAATFFHVVVAVSGGQAAWWVTLSFGMATALFVWWVRASVMVKQRLRTGNPELLPKLTEHLPVMVYQFRTFPNGHSSVTYTNDAIRTIYEIDPEAAREDGSRMLDLVHPDDRQRIEESLRHSYFAVRPWAGEFRVVLPNAGLQWRFAQAVVERMPDGGTLWHGFVADITSKKLAEESSRFAERMRLAKERAEDSDKAKNSFLAMMSHELRTPMHAVMGFLELLRGDDRKQDLDHIAAAEKAARAMLAILDDLLELARSESDTSRLVKRAFDLQDWLRGLATIFRSRAEEKNLSFTMHVAEDLPASIETDRVRLTQCLFALLDNAVKFTQQGGIELRVSSSRTPSLSRSVRFEVRDTGIGIPADQLDRIFEPFARADESVKRRFGGLGVGLSICHRICQDLGATLHSQSTVGKGSEFFIELAVDSVVVPEIKETSPQTETKLDLHILIAEDQATNQKLLGLMLKRLGCTYVVASNGIHAVREFQDTTFDVVLMDIQMPEMDGLSATREIRVIEKNSSASHQTPIIAVTANAFESDREECLGAGMSDFLAKPVNMEKLSNALRSASVRQPV